MLRDTLSVEKPIQEFPVSAFLIEEIRKSLMGTMMQIFLLL